MAMGTRKKRERQEGLWVASSEIVGTPAHAFYDRLNEILDRRHFDRNVEQLCRRYYKGTLERPNITPGVYFRALLLGYFEGIDSERGIAWRLADSLSMRRFIAYALTEETPDHSSISRTRRLFAVETHTAVFRWVLKILAEEGMVEGKTVSIDATTLEANAALRSLVRRDNGQKYDDYLKDLAKAAGIENPTREQLGRIDRKRKKKGSNKEWKNPYDPDARIAKMKDGSTHMAHKAEHAVDLSSGAMLAVTLQGADQGDTTTIHQTLAEAGEAVAELIEHEAATAPAEEPKVNLGGIEEAVADKGVSQRRRIAGSARDRLPQLHSRTGQRPAEVERESGGAEAGVRQPAAGQGRPQQAATAEAKRTDGTEHGAHVRNRRNETCASERKGQHSEASAGACGRLQLGADHAETGRNRQAPAVAGGFRVHFRVVRLAIAFGATTIAAIYKDRCANWSSYRGRTFGRARCS